MKKIFTLSAVIVMALSLSQTSVAQTYLDTANFFIAAQIKPSDFTQWPDSVAAWRVYGDYDLDNDGKKEFLVIVDPATTLPSDTSMPSILRFEASGNDSYELVWHAVIPYTNVSKGSWPCLTIADIDIDGNKEIIFGLPSNATLTSTANPERIFIYEYDSDISNFPADPTMTSNLGFPDYYYYAITSIVADDVDADGEVELVLSARRAYGGGSGSGSTRPLMIYHLFGGLDGFGTLEREFIDTLGTFDGGYYFNNYVLDFDGDGKKEIWGFTWDMISFAVYEATGKDTYVLQTDVNKVTTPLDFGEQNSVSFFDANKDGKLEMFLAGQVSAPSAIFYLANSADVSTIVSSDVKWLTSALNANFQGADIGDIDGDGEVDFFIGDYGTNRKVYRLRHLTGMPFDDSTGYKLDTLYHAPGDSTYAFPNVTVCNDLDGDGKREVIIVNSNTRGDHPEDVGLIILESKVAVLSVGKISDAVPAAFELMQNYPNPFNPTSTIRFSVINSSPVELYISNTLGQKVATLLNGKMESGTHEVTFNADGLASGTYFYTLKSGNVLQTKKMTLVK